MNRIVVTGAAGFLGAYVVTHLLNQGYKVVALINLKELKIQSENLTVIHVDLCDRTFVEKVSHEIGQCQTVIHLAADIHVPGDGQTIMVNCLGTYHVTELANQLRAEKLIYMSSVPVIGSPVQLPVTELHPTKPKTLYHITKLAGEHIVEQVGRVEMAKVILRIPSPVGKGMRHNVFLYRILEQCYKKQDILLYGSGKRVQNYIDVRDIAEAVGLAATKRAEGVFLIAGESVSNLQLAETCIACTNADVQIQFDKMKDIEESDCWEISGAKAKKMLGYEPRYTLKETVKWIYSAMRGEE